MVGRRPHISNMRLEPVNGARWQRHFSPVVNGARWQRHFSPAAPPQSRIELVLSLDELPRLGFLPLIFCNKLKMKRRRHDNSFFARMKGVPEFVGPHGTEG
jgi:hypothetical protein